jgi:hypothetical protein
MIGPHCGIDDERLVRAFVGVGLKHVDRARQAPGYSI